MIFICILSIFWGVEIWIIITLFILLFYSVYMSFFQIIFVLLSSWVYVVCFLIIESDYSLILVNFFVIVYILFFFADVTIFIYLVFELIVLLVMFVVCVLGTLLNCGNGLTFTTSLFCCIYQVYFWGFLGAIPTIFLGHFGILWFCILSDFINDMSTPNEPLLNQVSNVPFSTTANFVAVNWNVPKSLTSNELECIIVTLIPCLWNTKLFNNMSLEGVYFTENNTSTGNMFLYLILANNGSSFFNNNTVFNYVSNVWSLLPKGFVLDSYIIVSPSNLTEFVHWVAQDKVNIIFNENGSLSSLEHINTNPSEKLVISLFNTQQGIQTILDYDNNWEKFLNNME